MSDNNSPSKDYSQGASQYSETSMTVNGIPSQKQEGGVTPSPSALFSNRPIATPGSFTFSIKNKEGKETLIENSWNRAPSVGAEISKNKEGGVARKEKELEKIRSSLATTLETLKTEIDNTFSSLNDPSMKAVKERLAPNLLKDEGEIFELHIKNLEYYIAQPQNAFDQAKIEDALALVQKDIKTLQQKQSKSYSQKIIHLRKITVLPLHKKTGWKDLKTILIKITLRCLKN